MVERFAERHADREDRVVLERAGLEALVQRDSRHELGDQVQRPALDPRLEEGGDRRVREARLARASRCARCPVCAWSTRLSATSRCRTSSRARHTTPKPPAPRRASAR